MNLPSAAGAGSQPGDVVDIGTETLSNRMRFMFWAGAMPKALDWMTLDQSVKIGSWT
ncbi:MAG: hypothetical protein WBF71_00405 [Microthrixaceae bacterium]